MAGRTDNYPDDIRQYDGDPRSPFYDSSGDDALDEAKDGFESEHFDLLANLKRLDIDHGVEVKTFQDPDRRHIDVKLYAEGYDCEDCEEDLDKAFDKLEPGDENGIEAALDIIRPENER